MVQSLLPGRRRFLGTAAMTLAAARFGTVDALETNQQPSRLLMALDRATGWINSPLSSVPGVAGKVVLVQFRLELGLRGPPSSPCRPGRRLFQRLRIPRGRNRRKRRGQLPVSAGDVGMADANADNSDENFPRLEIR